MPDQKDFILRVENLSVAYRHGQAWHEAVRNVSLSIAPGQVYGLVGESGSGKSTLALALLRHLPENGRITNGQIWFENQDILRLTGQDLRKIWGARIALVPQDPVASLNPSLRIGEQLAEGIQAHTELSGQALRERVLSLLTMVRLPEPEQIASSYPHQLSGGMKQRILIASALSLSPSLLVLDEPTTSLDVTTQAAVLNLIKDLAFGSKTAVLYITHNLGVVAQNCSRVAVMYAGELVEVSSKDGLFQQPGHPYTQGLLASVPGIGMSKMNTRLQAIPGSYLPLNAQPNGCSFTPRCPLAGEVCEIQPDMIQAGVDHWIRCHKWEQSIKGNPFARSSAADGQPGGLKAPTEWSTDLPGETALKLRGLRVEYALPRSLSDYWASTPRKTISAVRDIDLSVRRALTLGLVGESGSGKTTLARAIVGLVERSAGEVELFGAPLPAALEGRGIEILRELQMIFQNPEEALNPHITIGESLRRPLMNLGRSSQLEAGQAVARLLAMVRLPLEYAARFPGQLSGGEKQRVAVARAYAAQPGVIIADEPVSALDVSVQASILNLLVDLQLQAGTTLLFISHDIAVVGYLADLVAVVYLGALMELVNADNLFKPPFHPYTEALLSAVPSIEPKGQLQPIILEAEIPSLVNLPSGCPFHTRCHRSLGEICQREAPPWQVTRDGDQIYCHIPLADLEQMQGRSVLFPA